MRLTSVRVVPIHKESTFLGETDSGRWRTGASWSDARIPKVLARRTLVPVRTLRTPRFQHVRDGFEFCLCEHEILEFHQGASQTEIQERTEQTRTELVAHPSLQPPMRPRTNPRRTELFCELPNRGFNAPPQPHLKFAKRFGILRFLMTSQRR